MLSIGLPSTHRLGWALQNEEANSVGIDSVLEAISRTDRVMRERKEKFIFDDIRLVS
jgi:hypothetical protein